MKIQQLQHFIWVAEEKGFRRASEKAMRSQAGLSTSLKNLEQYLGKPLFEKGQKATLTEYGKACLPEIQVFMESYDSLNRSLLARAKGERGKIVIGCIPSFLYSVFPVIMLEFTKQYPDVQITLTDNTAQRNYQKLLNRQIDVAFSSIPDAMDDAITAHPILSEELCVFMHKNHPLSDKNALEWQELQQHSFISNGISALLNKTPAGVLNARADYNVDNILSLISTLEQNVGLTVLTPLAIPKDNKNLVSVPLTNPTIHRNIGMLQAYEQTQKTEVKNFVKIAKTVLAEREGMYN